MIPFFLFPSPSSQAKIVVHWIGTECEEFAEERRYQKGEEERAEERGVREERVRERERRDRIRFFFFDNLPRETVSRFRPHIAISDWTAIGQRVTVHSLPHYQDGEREA